MVSWLVVFCFVVLSKRVSPFPEDAYSPHYRYINRGDVNIGVILSVHKSNNAGQCESEIENIHNIQDVEALTFAVKQINENDDILPNITIGFIILDDCLSQSLALARAIQFMPESARRERGTICRGRSCSDGLRNESLGGTLPQSQTERSDVFFDVMGVIGTYTSKLSIIVANVLSLFRLPQISPSATSDLLSDKERFPFFFRMVPPDKYQVQVITQLLRHFNWTHVSIVYSEGNYGREGVKKLKAHIQKLPINVCILETLEIPYLSKEEHFKYIISTLQSSVDVRVVIAYVEIQDAHSLSNALERSNTKPNFIWLGCDAMGLVLEEDPQICQQFPNSLAVRPYSGKVDVYNRFLTDLNLNSSKAVDLKSSTNPWLQELQQQKYGRHRQGLGLEEGTDDEVVGTKIPWSEQKGTGDDEYVLQTRFVETLLIDSMYAYAYALDNIVKQNCTGMPKESILKCVKAIGLYKQLKQTRFNGSHGEIKFNENGDAMGVYTIQQCTNETGVYLPKSIGHWDMQFEKLTIDDTISWPNGSAPKSSCKEPCSEEVGTIYYFTQQTCCWECVKCKVNEIVNPNLTRCESCPELNWPDEKTRTSCIPIAPFYIDLKHPVSIGICAVSLVGFLVCIWVGGTISKYKHEHIIKCTSVELNAIILAGTSMAYLLTASFLSPPNIYKCYANHVGFSFTFTLVYAPLLVKTNRIYRIFKAGKKTVRKPWFISKNSQIIISLMLIFVQVVIVIISTSLTPPEVKMRMPVITEKFVELFCNLPQAGLLASLCYNLVLVIICTFYAFKTRKLPDNYKESRYIGFCVDTTLLVWITFLPTYFTTSHSSAKVTILAVALLVNASVTLFCLFIPRIHSLYVFLRDPCAQDGRHYRDFRIVKHVVTRNRSVQLSVKDGEDDVIAEPTTANRISSIGTITSDTQETSEFITHITEHSRVEFELS